MKTYIIAYIIFLLIVWAIVKSGSRHYTHEEWEEQCKADFKKYGPVPEDKNPTPNN